MVRSFRPAKVKTRNQTNISFSISGLNSSNSPKGRQLEKVESQSQQEEEFIPLKMPCNWELAKKHAQSRSTAPDLRDVEKKGVTIETCICCGFDIQRKVVQFSDDPKVLFGFLGSGFPLFYNFIKFCILILTIMVIVKESFNVYTNVTGSYCSQYIFPNIFSSQVKNIVHLPNKVVYESNCPDSIFLNFSLANKINYVQTVQEVEVLNFIALTLIMIILVIFRKSQRDLDVQISQEVVSPSDFTICVKNIPTDLDVNYTTELYHIFENLSVQDPDNLIKIKKIALVYDIAHILIKEKHLDKLVEKKKAALRKNGFNFEAEEIIKMDEKIEKIEHSIHRVQDEYVETNKNLIGIAYISFETKEMRDLVIKENKHSRFERLVSYCNKGKTFGTTHEDLTWNGRKLFIEAAREPNDIDWEFIHVSTREKILCRIRSWIMYIIFEGGVFMAIYAISMFLGWMVDIAHQEELAGNLQESTLNKVRAFSYGISFIIVLFNKFCVAYITHHIVDSEKIANKTSFQVSFAIKYTIALFLNAAGISYIIDIILADNIYGYGGFIYNESIIFLLNAFLSPLVWLCDPWGLAKNIWRNYVLKNQDTYPMTQEEANTLMEQPNYLMAKRYSDIMKTMWFTFLFGSCIPIGVFASLLGLILYYYIDKYNVLYRRTVKESISFQLSKAMIGMLEMIIFFSAFGGMTITYAFTASFVIQDVILLGISLIYISLPMERISVYFFPTKHKDEVYSIIIINKKVSHYDDAKFKFETDYDRENPITKRKAISEWNKVYDSYDYIFKTCKENEQKNYHHIHKQVIAEDGGYRYEYHHY